jgi:predicted phage terminase large subunit-like protein
MTTIDDRDEPAATGARRTPENSGHLVSRAAVEPVVRRELARRRLLHFWQQTMFAYDFSEPVHRFIADKLERQSAGDPEYRRICFTIMPGIGKSTMLRGYVASELGRKPGTKAGFFSASERLVIRNSEDTMDLVRHESYPWSVTLKAEAVTHWTLSNKSSAFSLPVGAVLTGLRFDLALLDDIQPDPMTPDRLDDLEYWLRTKLETRIDVGGSLVLIQNRWGVRDIVARLQKGDDAALWKIYNLSAIADENDVLGRAVGETLSKRVTREFLDHKKLTLTPMPFATSYLGLPIDAESMMFQAHYFERRWDVLPPLTMRLFGLDTAWKKGAGRDSSACVYIGVDKFKNVYIIDAWNQQLLYTDLKARVMSYYDAHQPNIVAIEDASSGTGLIEEFIRSTDMPVKALKSTDSKAARGAALAVRFANGKVFLPKSGAWILPFIEQFLHFTGNGETHDDSVDSLELACRCLGEQKWLGIGDARGMMKCGADGTVTHTVNDDPAALSYAVVGPRRPLW